MYRLIIKFIQIKLNFFNSKKISTKLTCSVYSYLAHMSRKVNNNSVNNIENLLTYLLNLLYYISIKKKKEGFK